jgi:integrase
VKKRIDSPSEPQSIPPSEAAFYGWATTQNAQGELSPASIAKYKPLWMAYLGWCDQREVPWNLIKSDDIVEFLNGPAPGQGVGRRQAINPDRMTSPTKTRYWRLLRGVYTYASKNGLIDHNPALNVDENDRPRLTENDKISQVLEPLVFQKLASASKIETLFPKKTDANWWYARDRAIMAVLVQTGLTVTELIALRGMDLLDIQGRTVASGKVQPTLLGDTGAELQLDVMETAHNVGRTLPIRGDMALLVRAWLGWRNRLLVERSALNAPLSHRETYMREHGLNGPLFIARRARAGGEAFPIMDATSLYRSVSHALEKFRKIEKMPAENYIAKGPAIVRNSVIRYWIDELGPHAAAEMAGLKNMYSLRLK